MLSSVFQHEASKTSPLFIAFIVPGVGGQQERGRQRIWGRTVGGQGWGIQRVGIWSIRWMKRSIRWMVRSIGSMDWSSSALSIGVASMSIAWMVICSIWCSVLTYIVGSITAIIVRLLSNLVGAVSPFRHLFNLSRPSLLPSISLSAPFFLHPETGAIWNNIVFAALCLQCKARKVLNLDTDFRWMILDFESSVEF